MELKEATTVINILEDLGINAPPIRKHTASFLSKLKVLIGKDFDKENMAAEFSRHEFLRDLVRDYIGVLMKKLSCNKETFHVANLALFVFTEHVGLCKRIYGDVNA